jgi:hypothetical protein
MEQKTIPYDCQKDIMTFLSKLAQFAEVLAKILPVLFSLSLIPGFPYKIRRNKGHFPKCPSDIAVKAGARGRFRG